jgi:hypothetical protein
VHRKTDVIRIVYFFPLFTDFGDHILSITMVFQPPPWVLPLMAPNSIVFEFSFYSKAAPTTIFAHFILLCSWRFQVVAVHLMVHLMARIHVDPHVVFVVAPHR